MEENPMRSKRRMAACALALMFALGSGAMAASAEGRILAVNAMTKEILLDNGLKLTFHDGTTIMVDGKPSRFEAVKEGGKVKASYEEKDGKTMATTIEVSE
jgi:hypothetical protein